MGRERMEMSQGNRGAVSKWGRSTLQKPKPKGAGAPQRRGLCSIEAGPVAPQGRGLDQNPAHQTPGLLKPSSAEGGYTKKGEGRRGLLTVCVCMRLEPFSSPN